MVAPTTIAARVVAIPNIMGTFLTMDRPPTNMRDAAVPVATALDDGGGIDGGGSCVSETW